MKHLLTLFILLNACFISFSQSSEGHFKYAVDLSTDDPENEMILSMLQGTTFDLYFDKNRSKTILEMGGLIKLTIISDHETQQQVTLTSGMMGNTGAYSLVDNSDDAEDFDYTITLSSETKSVIGIPCKKALLKNSDGLDLTVWYTEEFDMKFNSNFNNYFLGQVPGIPLEYAMYTEGMNLYFRAVSFDDKLDVSPNFFDVKIPEGYEVVDESEMDLFGE